MIEGMISETVDVVVGNAFAGESEEKDLNLLEDKLNEIFGYQIDLNRIEGKAAEEVSDLIYDDLIKIYDEKEKAVAAIHHFGADNDEGTENEGEKADVEFQSRLPVQTGIRRKPRPLGGFHQNFATAADVGGKQRVEEDKHHGSSDDPPGIAVIQRGESADAGVAVGGLIHLDEQQRAVREQRPQNQQQDGGKSKAYAG